jgi:MFS transporter, SP family, general alpha glucoside:H+ symporter
LTFWGLVVLQIILLIAAGGGINPVPGSAAVKTSVAMILIFNTVYTGTIGATAYTIVAEVPTARLRSKTISLAIGLQ